MKNAIRGVFHGLEKRVDNYVENFWSAK